MDKAKIKEKITVDKKFCNSVEIGGKTVPIKHTWGRNGSKPDKIGFNTTQIKIEKYKNRPVSGISGCSPENAVPYMVSKNYGYNDIYRKLGFNPLYEISYAHADKIHQLNVALNEGIQQSLDLITGVDTIDLYNEANAQTGVGNSATAPSATDTDLIGASKTYKGMNTSFPSRSGQTVSFKSDYIDTEAEYAWEEFIVRNAAATPEDLIRATSSQGTKPSGVTWTLTVDITMS